MAGQKRILALDYGSKRIGLAVSDPLGLTAQPLPFLPNRGKKHWIPELKKIMAEKSVELLLLGLPVSLDDTLGPRALEIQKLAQTLRAECGTPVELADERFTTRAAEDFLVQELDVSRAKRKEIRDSMAAALLLKSYLERAEP